MLLHDCVDVSFRNNLTRFTRRISRGLLFWKPCRLAASLPGTGGLRWVFAIPRCRPFLPSPSRRKKLRNRHAGHIMEVWAANWILNGFSVQMNRVSWFSWRERIRIPLVGARSFRSGPDPFFDHLVRLQQLSTGAINVPDKNDERRLSKQAGCGLPWELVMR